MEIHFFGSGSRGNALLVRTRRTRVLIDAGLPAETLRERMVAAGILPSSLDAIAVTHGHLDHVAATPIFSRDHGTLVWAARAMYRDPSKRPERLSLFEPGRPFLVGDLKLRPFRVPHDAEPTVGFVVEATDGSTLGYTTDLGHPSNEVAAALAGVRTLVLESNHDLRMLREGPYPKPLQDRIAGPEGHLSNEQAGALLGRIAHPGLARVVLAHLSEKNNLPALARESAEAALARAGFRGIPVELAHQDRPVGPFSV